MMEIITLPLDCINGEPKFNLSRFGEESALEESLKTFGQLMPVLGVKDDQGRVILLNGFRRLRLLRQLGASSIKVSLLPGDLSDFEQFVLVLELQGRGGNFHYLDQWSLCEQAKKFSPTPHQWEKIYALTGLHSKRQHEKMKVMKSLKAQECEFVWSHQWPLQLTLSWARFHQEDRQGLVSWIGAYPFNQNRWVQLFDLIYDLLKRDAVTLAALRAETEADSRLKSFDLESLDALREVLFLKRYPQFGKRQREFAVQKRALSLPANAQLEPSLNFESDYIDLKIRLRKNENREPLLQCLQSEQLEEMLKSL